MSEWKGDYQSDYRRNFVNEGGSAGALTLHQEERVYAAAVFCQLRMPLTGRLDAMAALRFDRFGFRVNDLLAAPDDPDDSGERGMGGLSPSFGVHFDLGDHGVFASVARSFETPTTTELANRPEGAGGFNPGLAPQEGWTFEGGIRGVAGRRSAYDLAVFHNRAGRANSYRSRCSRPRDAVSTTTPDDQGCADSRSSTRTVLSSLLAARPGLRLRGRAFHRVSRRGQRIRRQPRSGYRAAPPRSLATGPAAECGSVRSGWRYGARCRPTTPTMGLRRATASQGSASAQPISAWAGFTLSPFAAVTNLTNARYASSVVVNAFGGRYFEPGPDRGGHMGLTVRWETAGDRS